MNKFKAVSILLLAALASLGVSQAEIIRKIPLAMGLASHPVNGGHCLVSDGEFQFAAFYDADHQMTIAKRKLGDTEWDFVKLPQRVGWDTHNKILIFLDREGYLHVTGNMHNDPLVYFRTEKPGDIHTLKDIGRWTGVHEDRVTYPTLLKLRDGSIHMTHRYGGSGNGMRLLKHYDEKTQTWSGPGGPFINGMDNVPDVNAYPFGPIREGPDGVLHIAWCWRETPDVLTNFHICYAKSEDGGFTWLKSTGVPYDLPITPKTAEIVDPVTQQSGLINIGSLSIGRDGVPYIGYTRFDGDGHNQIFVAAHRPDSGWTIRQITHWPYRFEFSGGGTIPEYPPSPGVSCGKDELIVHYSYGKAQPSRGVIRIPYDLFFSDAVIDVTPEPSRVEQLGVPDVIATNIGPLPDGQIHYMQQEQAPPNRDRKPDNPKQPTMIYIVETDGK
ncbi:MAG: hypothetical protein GC154_18750 [bacterium]|nr:hypothetical protein [bacterium]